MNLIKNVLLTTLKKHGKGYAVIDYDNGYEFYVVPIEKIIIDMKSGSISFEIIENINII